MIRITLMKRRGKAVKYEEDNSSSPSASPPPPKKRVSKKSAVKSEEDGSKKKISEKNELLSSRIASGHHVDPARIQVLWKSTLVENVTESNRPVLYWMSRDQRVADNWALLYARHQASLTNSPFAVIFNLANGFLGATVRHFGFMIRGLEEVHQDLKKLQIPFFLLRGANPESNVSEFVLRNQARLLVADYSPLRIGKMWKLGVSKKLEERQDNLPQGFEFVQVDAHNIVPVWLASDKLEYAARTIRPKIHKQLDRFLVEFPPLSEGNVEWNGTYPVVENFEWDKIIDELDVDRSVGEVDWLQPGEKAAHKTLNGFITQKLKSYDTKRNDPNNDALSNMSPYLHFGQIAAQRVALEVRKNSSISSKSCEAYLEELIVRRELAENYVHYNSDAYDRIDGLYPQYDNNSWAQITLMEHSKDKREYIYSLEQLENARTHDKLWNASQLEMVHTGKMHGFMRMYWAKKILEWTSSPEEALNHAIYLNDRYELDGRDPNGYVGCAWSIGGLHDQGWRERPVFGKIRYMNYEGCSKKFNVPNYISKITNLIKKIR